MDQGIWAIWYDLADADRQAYFDWLHGTHLPDLLQRPGVAWAAHYRITGGDARLAVFRRRGWRTVRLGWPAGRIPPQSRTPMGPGRGMVPVKLKMG